MPQIGLFSRSPGGFTGVIKTLSLDIAVTLVPAEPSEAENAPDFRIHLGAEGDGPEVGAAWRRTGERAGAYLSLVVDDPSFASPIHAHLFQANDGSNAHNLVWSRPSRRDVRA